MQNTFSQSGNDSKWFLTKIIFQNRYVALETPRDPPPFMANAILNFHFDFPHPSLTIFLRKIVFEVEFAKRIKSTIPVQGRESTQHILSATPPKIAHML